MGANNTSKAVQRISQASAGIEAVTIMMDNESFVPKMSNVHTYKSTMSDEEVIIQILVNLKPFEKSFREHSNFQRHFIRQTGHGQILHFKKRETL